MIVFVNAIDCSLRCGLAKNNYHKIHRLKKWLLKVLLFQQIFDGLPKSYFLTLLLCLSVSSSTRPSYTAPLTQGDCQPLARPNGSKKNYPAHLLPTPSPTRMYRSIVTTSLRCPGTCGMPTGAEITHVQFAPVRAFYSCIALRLRCMC